MSVCATTQAQVYLGAGYGITEPTNMGDGNTFPETEGDAGYRVYVGNALYENFAVEFSYVDLGTYEVGTIDGQPDPLVFEDTISITGGDIAIVGKWNWTRYLNVYSRAGVFVWEGERYVHETVDVNGVMVEQEATLSFDGYDVSVGIGLDYQILRRVGVQLEANAYMTDEVANYLYGLSVYYTF